MGAKSMSLIAQLIGALWIAGWSAYKFSHEMPSVKSIVVSGLFIAAAFSPVYFNLIMDKFVSLIGKKHNTSENAN